MSRPRNYTARSRNYTVAAVLAGLLSLANAVTALVLLPQGADKINHSSNQPPYAVILIEVVVGLLGIVAAYGVFRTQRWGVILTLVLMVINVLTSVPGIPFGPTTLDKVSSVLGLLVAAVVIYLLLRRDTRAKSKVELSA
jgi:peptidoglycan/LPS O-acetylase OafA/YrhL